MIMKRFIGTKIIHAEPMEKEGKAGYKVVFKMAMKAGHQLMHLRKHTDSVMHCRSAWLLKQ